jgi:hypothetical protein
MNEQFVRLELDVCERVNQMAREERKKVSEVVNEILRQFLARKDAEPAK